MCQTIRFLTLWQSWYNSSRTSRFSFCGSYKRWFCVCKCMCMCACLPEHNEGRSHPTLPVQQQQQRYNTSESRKAHINRNACVVPFQLATPPGFQVSRIPKGNLVCICTCTRALFLHIGNDVYRPRVFPRAFGCGTLRGAACTLGVSLGPGRAPWRVVWAFKVSRSGK